MIDVLTVWRTFLYSVPVSRLPELVSATRKDLDAYGVESAMQGHVGDGNFFTQRPVEFSESARTGNLHSLLAYTDDEGEKLVTELSQRMVQRALDLDGTCKLVVMVGRYMSQTHH